MSLFKSTILVTGGAGFIGSALVAELNRRGYEDIVICDILGEDEKWKNLRGLKYSRYIEAPKLLSLLRSDFRTIGTILHLGACSATTELDCSYLVENNYEFTRQLSKWAIENSKRFVYASSAATYGDGSSGMDDFLTDLSKYRPMNMYGYSKQMFDMHAEKSGWLKEIVGVKYFNVFGPNEYHKGGMRSVVYKAYHQLEATGSVKLFKSENPDYADGEQKRDFFYVKDAVDATLHLAECEELSGLYNLGSGRASTWKQLVEPIFDVLNIPEKIEFVELPPNLKKSYQYYTCSNIRKLMSTGWSGPKFTLQEAVMDYVKNYLIGDRYLGSK
jgi:ADP-L-glycero-D-manno-heptose 6-epimerase